MVVSCLTIYVVAFSSVILLGRSYATTPVPMEVTPRQNYRRGNKIHFQAHVKNSSMDIPEASKPDQKLQNEHSEKPKLLQTAIVPSDAINVIKLSNDTLRQVNATHSYFALFDPVNNVTKKFEVTSGDVLPSSIRYDALCNNSLEKPNYKESGKIRKDMKSDSQGKIKNFIEWNTLRDSERETRIHYNGITAKETVVMTGVDEETGKRQGLKLRQLTDGIHFIQLIYNFENEIQDCEYIRQKPAIEKFLNTFRNNVENVKNVYENPTENIAMRQEEDDDDYLEGDEGKIEKYSPDEDLEQYEGEDLTSDREYRNVTFQIIRSEEKLPREFAEWMNYSRLKRKCRENHRILRRLAFDRKHGNDFSKKLAEEHIERVKRSLDFPLIFPGTKWCGKSDIADKYTALGGFSKTDKCCRSHDYCRPLIPAFERKYGFFNFRPYSLGHCLCDRRRKRDIMDVLLVPGTKWCGKGRRATKYTSLGGFSRTDKCCRVHDTMCPYWIGSLEEKYGLFNWRINTIMHCRCDKRFRACLKMAKTGTANFVGKLFFNVVQTKCFVLKPQEVCLKYSWWGTCEKKEYRKKAYLKDNLSY